MEVEGGTRDTRRKRESEKTATGKNWSHRRESAAAIYLRNDFRPSERPKKRAARRFRIYPRAWIDSTWITSGNARSNSSEPASGRGGGIIQGHSQFISRLGLCIRASFFINSAKDSRDAFYTSNDEQNLKGIYVIKIIKDCSNFFFSSEGVQFFKFHSGETTRKGLLDRTHRLAGIRFRERIRDSKSAAPADSGRGAAVLRNSLRALQEETSGPGIGCSRSCAGL